MPRSLLLTSENLAVLTAGGHALYLVKTPDAADWDYQRPLTVAELPGLRFKRHLLMYANRGHKEALELEAVSTGPPPTRADLLGKTLHQE